MRHRSGVTQPLPVATLPFGVALAAVVAALVLLSRRPQAAPTRLRRTLLGAIAMPVVTVRAQAEPTLAALTTHRPQP